MKHLKIDIPNGYEIDKEKSTFENIVFKEIKPLLPTKWGDLNEVYGYYINVRSHVVALSPANGLLPATFENRNIFKTKEQAEASIALAQLSQLREVYRNGWLPDWTDDESKYCIGFYGNKIHIWTYTETSQFLSFQNQETRDLFYNNFKELIEQAKPLFT